MSDIRYRFDKDFSQAAWLRLFRESGYNAWWTERHAGASLEYARLVITAWDGGTAVGSVTLHSDGANFAIVDDLVVHPDYRRRGIGSALMRLVLERIRPLDLHLVQLYPVPGREPFFERFGFRVQRGATVMDLAARPRPGAPGPGQVCR